VCKVKIPLAKNVDFYGSAAAAQEAGFRPCLRCRPESAPGTPAWKGTSTTVNRALRLISEGALDSGSIGALSDRLGITPRHLSRLFSQHIGVAPKAVAQTRRLQIAKKLLDETPFSITDIALLSGYRSVRRFNDHFKQVYARSPSSLRQKPLRQKPLRQKPLRQKTVKPDSDIVEEGFNLRLSYRPPFDFKGILNFLKVRAVPGVEFIDAAHYRRVIKTQQGTGLLAVGLDEVARQLTVQVTGILPDELVPLLEKVKRIFDLDADPIEINDVIGADRRMRKILAENPGQRVPGCWDPYEIAVRAIVGQQVSVKGATTVMGRIAAIYGLKNLDGIGRQDVDLNAIDSAGARAPDNKLVKNALGISFPRPEDLSDLDVTSLSMPTRRAQAIKDMSRAVVDGDVSFDTSVSLDELKLSLINIKGIGPWTAEYIAMRAVNDPNAFLHSDLVLLKVAAAQFSIDKPDQLLELSKAWQPWRAYAGMHLWRQAAKK
jgi:AraC family transcriptional regulator of adaptative response / DNA-3-methyladenine glycosylase II